MEACHILLGRHWQSDLQTIQNERENTYKSPTPNPPKSNGLATTRCLRRGDSARPPILFTYNRRNKKIHEANDGGTRGIKGNSHEANKERARGGIEESKESGDQQVGSTVS